MTSGCLIRGPWRRRVCPTEDRETERLLFLETCPDLARHFVLRGSPSLNGKSYPPKKFPGLVSHKGPAFWQKMPVTHQYIPYRPAHLK